MRLMFLFLVILALMSGCQSRPDYSRLKIVGADSRESIGNSCEAIGSNYNFYRYTCTTWTIPAERCLQNDEEANQLVKKISDESGQACRILQIIRSQ